MDSVDLINCWIFISTMNEGQLVDQLDKDLKDLLVSRTLSAFVLSLVRKHNANELDLYQDVSLEALTQILLEFGASPEDPMEFYGHTFNEDLSSIETCLNSGDSFSAMILVSAFVERQINVTTRVCMRLRNFSHRKITEAIKGVSFIAKVNTLLPLLDVKLTERQCQIALKQNSIRNESVHFKTVPNRWHDDGSSRMSEEKLQEDINRYFEVDPFSLIKSEFQGFLEHVVSEQPHVQHTCVLVERTFGIQGYFL